MSLFNNAVLSSFINTKIKNTKVTKYPNMCLKAKYNPASQ